MLRELNVVEQRYRAVLEVLSGIPVIEVAERYGVARQTVHRWMARYRTDGIAGLADRSHAPKQHPWRVSAEIEALVCELRRAHRRWGPRRLVFELDRRGYPGVSRSTVYRVLVRHQLIEPVSRRRRRDQYIRWERPAPMQLWQLDVTASLFLADGRECKVITGVDDHSRFCVIATVVLRATGRAVCSAFVTAMQAYGVPDEVLSDNGKQFTGRFGKPHPAEVLFERICWESGITQRLTKPRSPTTTGKIERLHQTLQEELLTVHEPFETIEEAQAALDAWRQDYNAGRPHQSLNMAFPATRFVPATGETLPRSRSMTARRSSRPVRPAVTSSGTKHRLTRHHDSMSDDQLRRFSVGQRAAVASAFKLAGRKGELLVAPIASKDERAFLLEPAASGHLVSVALEQILTHLLGRRVWIAARTRQWGKRNVVEQTMRSGRA
jgi:transposase InsO family protein